MSFCEFFDRYSLTIARRFTTLLIQRFNPGNYTTRGTQPYGLPTSARGSIAVTEKIAGFHSGRRRISARMFAIVALDALMSRLPMYSITRSVLLPVEILQERMLALPSHSLGAGNTGPGLL